MIKDITRIIEHSPKYIREFMSNCSIEEKIDTHYITIEIISSTNIRISRPNGNEIDRVDLILNSMWHNLMLDWNYLMLSNKQWFKDHVGLTIKTFYFPCEQPILTKYNSNIRYVFDRTIINNCDVDPEYILGDLKFSDAYAVSYKHLLNKIEKPGAVFDLNFEKVKSGELAVGDMFKMLINSDSKIFALSEPEGYIFKYNNKIYQLTNNINRKVEWEKSSYEFLLEDFVKYCKTTDYTEKITQSYVKTVCNIFNDYIINKEKKTHFIEYNIDPNSIEHPNLGMKFDIGYEYIPDQVTKTLCQESVLYKNIFKVLLANLRKGKDFKHCILLNKKTVEDWNNIMKNIKIRNIFRN